jgi:hypothetical protein
LFEYHKSATFLSKRPRLVRKYEAQSSSGPGNFLSVAEVYYQNAGVSFSQVKKINI